MAEAENVKIVDNDDELDIIDTIIDVVSIGGGVVTGGAVSYGLNKMIPAATNMGESVMRWVGIGSAGVTAQWLTTSAIQDDLSTIKTIAHWSAGRAKNALAKKE